MEEIEKFRENEITCPYCNYEFTDSWEVLSGYDGDSVEEDCPECEKKFTAIKNVDVSYTTRGLCKENKKNHNWDYFNHKSSIDGTKYSGRRCLTCDKYEFNKK